MSRMEDDVKRFFQRIVYSVALTLVWLFITLSIGIFYNWLVPQAEIKIANIIFYALAVISLAALIWILARIWKEKFPHG